MVRGRSRQSPTFLLESVHSPTLGGRGEAFPTSTRISTLHKGFQSSAGSDPRRDWGSNNYPAFKSSSTPGSIRASSGAQTFSICRMGDKDGASFVYVMRCIPRNYGSEWGAVPVVSRDGATLVVVGGGLGIQYRKGGALARIAAVWRHRTQWNRTALVGERLSTAGKFVQEVLAEDTQMSS